MNILKQLHINPSRVLIALFLIFSVIVSASAEGSSATARASSADEALRMAKSAAIQIEIDRLHKDDLFRNILLSAFPQAIKITEQSSKPIVDAPAATAFEAKVTLSIGEQEVLLAQRTYEPQATGLLDTAETLLGHARIQMQDAKNSEQNLDLAAAYVTYSQARRDIQEAQENLRALKNSSIISSKGSNLDVLRQNLTALDQSIETSLAGLKRIQRESGKDPQNQDTQRLIQAALAQTEKLSAAVNTLGTTSPYYDLPRETLQARLSDQAAALQLATDVRTQLQGTLSSLDNDQTFIRKQIELSISDVDYAITRLKGYRTQIEQELQDPRLNRQARAESTAAFWKSMGDAALWSVWHQSTRTAVLTWDIPWVIAPANQNSQRPGLNMDLTVQRAFPGIWLQTRLIADTSPLLNNGSYQQAIRQTADVAFHGPFLIGGGFGWDWNRRLIKSNNSLFDGADLAPAFFVRVHAGISSAGLTHPDLLATLSWQIPQKTPFDINAAYLLNADLEVRANIQDTVGLYASLYTRSYQNNVINTSSNDWTWNLGWALGANLLFLGPWDIGVRYRQDWKSTRLDSLEGASPTIQGWTLSFAYSI